MDAVVALALLVPPHPCSRALLEAPLALLHFNQ